MPTRVPARRRATAQQAVGIDRDVHADDVRAVRSCRLRAQRGLDRRQVRDVDGEDVVVGEEPRGIGEDVVDQQRLDRMRDRDLKVAAQRGRVVAIALDEADARTCAAIALRHDVVDELAELRLAEPAQLRFLHRKRQEAGDALERAVEIDADRAPADERAEARAGQQVAALRERAVRLAHRVLVAPNSAASASHVGIRWPGRYSLRAMRSRIARSICDHDTDRLDSRPRRRLPHRSHPSS